MRRESGVEIHPEASRARGIASGDWISIETCEGRVRARVRLNADLDPRVVVGEHGWWQGCAQLGAPGYDPSGPTSAAFNLIIGTAERDPISGPLAPLLPLRDSTRYRRRRIGNDLDETGVRVPVGPSHDHIAEGNATVTRWTMPGTPRRSIQSMAPRLRLAGVTAGPDRITLRHASCRETGRGAQLWSLAVAPGARAVYGERS